MKTIEELIKVKRTKIGDEEVNSVDMRDIYNYLEIKKDYTSWCKAQIKRAMLEEDFDYIKLTQKGEKSKTGQIQSIYVCTIDAAKHIAMMSQTEKGKKVRKYFINIEKIAKNTLGIEKIKKEIALLEAEEELKRQDIISKKVDLAKKLQNMGANFDPIALANGEFKRILPQDVGEALSETITEIRRDVRAYSATYLLNKFDIKVKTPEWNDYLIEIGLMETYNYKGKTMKKFVKISNWYGYNKFASSVKEKPYQVVYYEDKFLDLVQMLRNDGYID